MFHILGFLFIIIIAILLIGLSIIGTVIRSIFGLGSRRSSNTYRNDMEIINPEEGILSMADNSPALLPTKNLKQDKEETAHGRHKKLFSQDEGEYVDFEEIKEVIIIAERSYHCTIILP